MTKGTKRKFEQMPDITDRPQQEVSNNQGNQHQYLQENIGSETISTPSNHVGTSGVPDIQGAVPRPRGVIYPSSTSRNLIEEFQNHSSGEISFRNFPRDGWVLTYPSPTNISQQHQHSGWGALRSSGPRVNLRASGQNQVGLGFNNIDQNDSEQQNSVQAISRLSFGSEDSADLELAELNMESSDIFQHLRQEQQNTSPVSDRNLPSTNPNNAMIANSGRGSGQSLR